MSKKTNISIPVEIVQSKIYFIRGYKVMLDQDLAERYGVTNRRLKEQVRRNLRRFPDDFMLQLTWEEVESSRSHFATLNRGGNIKYLPYAFTEQGIAMLSSVLNSEKAIDVNIQIIRVFTQLREFMISNKELALKIQELEKKYDNQFKSVFEAIRRLMTYPDDGYKRTKIGFKVVAA